MRFPRSLRPPYPRAARWPLLGLAAVLTLGLSACKISLTTLQDAGADNVGGSSSTSGVTPGAGGAGGGLDAGAGADAPLANFKAPYAELCGGAKAPCIPGPQDGCTLGGDPGMNGVDGGAAALACQLSSVKGGVVAQCAKVGTFAAGDPCDTVANCGAELGCVATASGGVCRAYCCGDTESCGPGTYCAPVPMNESTEKIPVCITATPCTLLDDANSCPMGLTCAIVRDDGTGTTSCIEPGTGQRGDTCPCAAGFTCSTPADTCVQLCHIGGSDCGEGTCMGGVSGYPDNIGTCTGYPN